MPLWSIVHSIIISSSLASASNGDLVKHQLKTSKDAAFVLKQGRLGNKRVCKWSICLLLAYKGQSQFQFCWPPQSIIHCFLFNSQNWSLIQALIHIMQLSVKESWRKGLHLTSHNHGAFFSIARKEEKERKKRKRGAVFGCTRCMWTSAFKR
jgi:hypothetical protein